MYYRVIARCGHLGSGRWMDVTLFVEAEDAMEVIDRVKTMPGVKGRIRGIQSVEEITPDEYLRGIGRLLELRRFPYFRRLIQGKHLLSKSGSLPIEMVRGESRHLKDVLGLLVRAVKTLKGEEIEQLWKVLSALRR